VGFQCLLEEEKLGEIRALRKVYRSHGGVGVVVEDCDRIL